MLDTHKSEYVTEVSGGAVAEADAALTVESAPLGEAAASGETATNSAGSKWKALVVRTKSRTLEVSSDESELRNENAELKKRVKQLEVHVTSLRHDDSSLVITSPRSSESFVGESAPPPPPGPPGFPGPPMGKPPSAPGLLFTKVILKTPAAMNSAPAAAGDLLSQIQAGKALKKADCRREESEVDVSMGAMMGAISKTLSSTISSRRDALKEDSSGDESDEDWD